MLSTQCSQLTLKAIKLFVQCSLVWPVLAGTAVDGLILIGILEYRG